MMDVLRDITFTHVAGVVVALGATVYLLVLGARRLRVWVTALQVGKLVIAIRNESEKFRIENKRLRAKNSALRAQLHEMTKDMEVLRAKLDREAAMVRELWERIRALNAEARTKARHQAEFNRRLLVYLSQNFNAAPEDVEAALGLTSEGDVYTPNTQGDE